MADVKLVLEKIDRVPPLSAAAARLLKMQSAPERSLAEVGKIVEVDAGLTAAVLKASNSAAFRRAEPITSVRMAVTYLGERMVLALALSGAVPGGMSAPLPGYDAAHGELWRHSLRTALAARDLARRCKPRVEGELAFTAGILHDLGKPIISTMVKAESLLASMDERHSDFLAAEIAACGMSHPEVGGELARRWQLPATLQAAIRYHHAPKEAPEELRPLVWLVHVADITSMMAGDATGADAMGYRLDPDSKDVLDLPRTEFEALLCRVEREMQKSLAMVEEP